MEKSYTVYQAEELLYNFDSEIEDKVASNKKAWCVNLSDKHNHFIYGPYNSLPELSKYIAYFCAKHNKN